jgi:predicted transcriptional regulator of viral defense system
VQSPGPRKLAVTAEERFAVEHLAKLADRGRLTRITQGLYRFPAEVVPVTPLGSYMEAVLWPGRRGVLSHATALDLYGLSDVNPTKVHVTLPPRYYPRRKETPAVYRFHHARLDPAEIQHHEGIPIVTPERAIRDAHAEHLGRRLIGQAIDDAEHQGLLPGARAKQLRAKLLPAPVAIAS